MRNFNVCVADREGASTVREEVSSVSDCPSVVEETTVKEYVKVIKCREYVIKKKNA